MEAAELKEIKDEITEWVDALDDQNLLRFLHTLKLSQVNKSDWWDQLSEEEIENINSGLSDINAGQVISSDDFWSALKNDA